MFLIGYSWNTILKVRNKTNDVIKKVDFTYDSTHTCDKVAISVKNIKPGENKLTGVNTLYDVSNLVISIPDIDKQYLIKSSIPKSYRNTIIINITDIYSDDFKFNIEEEE